MKLQIHQHSLLTRKVFSLFHNHQHIWSSHDHKVIIIAANIIIFLSIIKMYYMSLEVSTEPTLFMLVVGLVLIQVFITFMSKPSRRNSPGPSLHCHDNNLCLLPLSRRIQIISFVLPKTKIKHTYHTEHISYVYHLCSITIVICQDISCH